VFALERLK